MPLSLFFVFFSIPTAYRHYRQGPGRVYDRIARLQWGCQQSH